jgi:hypothetical protein
VRGRLREELRRLWLEPNDPRLLQLGFSLLYLLDMGLRVASDVELRTGPVDQDLPEPESVAPV